VVLGNEVDPFIVARFIAEDGEPDLPWMLMPETFAATTRPVQALHLGRIACAIVADPKAEKIVIRALLVRKARRRQGWGSRILSALEALFAGRPLAIPAVVPENMAPRSFPESRLATANTQPVRNENRVIAVANILIVFPR
jgi:GNAT superfamily N-acetyltransferase